MLTFSLSFFFLFCKFKIITFFHKFTTLKSTLDQFPRTLLGRITVLDVSPFIEPIVGGYFIDRDPKLFPYIMQYYRNGRILYDSSSVSEEMLHAELDFFAIPRVCAQILPNPQGLINDTLNSIK